ncbi:TPA: CAAX protease [Enterococcus faecalis]|nr:CAAX protease [Enterococcus faecalis]EIT5122340.1 CAAX protease [Enterococcus faecalis]HCQ8726475.1 CAAX protease [Enterococcus faecalis]HDT8179106.1 CAAX protease [Enterococcus faecalis]HDV0789510.1 CAAX protease [Enterococcus faecalis]
MNFIRKNTRAIRLIVVYFFAVLMQAGSLLLLAISLLFFYLTLCTHNMLDFLL